METLDERIEMAIDETNVPQLENVPMKKKKNYLVPP